MLRKIILEKISTSSDTHLDLAQMGIEDNELLEIALKIKRLRPDLKNIFLNNNSIGDNGAIILGKEFTTLLNLSFLDLQFNKIDKKGAIVITALKLTHPNLTIALHGNLISNAAEMQTIEESVMKKADSIYLKR